MRLHAAGWEFAETHGNDHARAYAAKRKELEKNDLKIKDSKWLRGHDGVRLRSMWNALSADQQTAMMLKTCDPSFPVGTFGILDERSKLVDKFGAEIRREVKIRKKSTHELSSKVKQGSRRSEAVGKLVSARAKYHGVSCKEQRALVSLHYDRGSMAGVMKAIVAGVQNTIQLARVTDRASTAEEAYAALATKLTDVFASVIGISSFDPESDSSEDAPSEEFALAIMQKAFDKLETVQRKVEQETMNSNMTKDAILEDTHIYFGKVTKITNT